LKDADGLVTFVTRREISSKTVAGQGSFPHLLPRQPDGFEAVRPALSLRNPGAYDLRLLWSAVVVQSARWLCKRKGRLDLIPPYLGVERDDAMELRIWPSR
jgi:hypothetical protein